MSFWSDILGIVVSGISDGVKEAINSNADNPNDSGEREDRFPNTDWHCDRCDAYLNYQNGFDDHKYTWKCTECGYKNSISRDNVFNTKAEFEKYRK